MGQLFKVQTPSMAPVVSLSKKRYPSLLKYMLKYKLRVSYIQDSYSATSQKYKFRVSYIQDSYSATS